MRPSGTAASVSPTDPCSDVSVLETLKSVIVGTPSVENFDLAATTLKS